MATSGYGGFTSPLGYTLIWAMGHSSDMHVLENLPKQFSDGALIAAKSGKPPIAAAKIEAVLGCKAEGLTQKATSIKLGMPASTVHKIWHLPKETQ
ncbi:hypothetical protein [Pseudomonas sp. yb_9]|uniref:hypothetical protein n=1 Tax=Pseudomonas sp. yb_9 TaxID=3367222 RepID=UPI00370AC565